MIRYRNNVEKRQSNKIARGTEITWDPATKQLKVGRTVTEINLKTTTNPLENSAQREK